LLFLFLVLFCRPFQQRAEPDGRGCFAAARRLKQETQTRRRFSSLIIPFSPLFCVLPLYPSPCMHITTPLSS
jgi:hypothetical protein